LVRRGTKRKGDHTFKLPMALVNRLPGYVARRAKFGSTLFNVASALLQNPAYYARQFGKIRRHWTAHDINNPRTVRRLIGKPMGSLGGSSGSARRVHSSRSAAFRAYRAKRRKYYRRRGKKGRKASSMPLWAQPRNRGILNKLWEVRYDANDSINRVGNTTQWKCDWWCHVPMDAADVDDMYNKSFGDSTPSNDTPIMQNSVVSVYTVKNEANRSCRVDAWCLYPKKDIVDSAQSFRLHNPTFLADAVSSLATVDTPYTLNDVGAPVMKSLFMKGAFTVKKIFGRQMEPHEVKTIKVTQGQRLWERSRYVVGVDTALLNTFYDIMKGQPLVLFRVTGGQAHDASAVSSTMANTSVPSFKGGYIVNVMYSTFVKWTSPLNYSGSTDRHAFGRSGTRSTATYANDQAGESEAINADATLA
jgi:hypothetical protein